MKTMQDKKQKWRAAGKALLAFSLAGAVLLVVSCKQSSKPAAAPATAQQGNMAAEQKSMVSGQIAAPKNCVPPDCRNEASPAMAGASAAAPSSTQTVSPVSGTSEAPAAQLKLDREFRSLLYSVFFRYASAQLGPSGRHTVAGLVGEARKAVHIRLTGRTDTSGDPALNEKLAQRRTNAVKRAFARNGVQSSIIETKIDTTGMTELEPGTVTPLLPKIEALRARRVDIHIETLQEAKKP